MTIELTGTLTGSVFEHTPETLAKTWDEALLILPQAKGATPCVTAPSVAKAAGKYPVVLFSHGSSGITPAIREFATWLASDLGVATVIPDSTKTEDRLAYSSPVARDAYEKIHAMRLAELVYASLQLKSAAWFNGNYVVAGTSEGGVAAARFSPDSEAVSEKGKIIFSWSCEPNYFVEAPGNVFGKNEPVLSVMSLNDKYFGRGNSYLDNPKAYGYPHEALKDNPAAALVLIPEAPHTLLNLVQTHGAVAAFLSRVFG